jgi:hypothetical protein
MSASSQRALLKVRIITSYKERVDKARKQRDELKLAYRLVGAH